MFQSPLRPFDPVLVAHAHELGVPVQLVAARQQRRPSAGSLDEPLPVGDDLERAVAVLPELHRVGDRRGLADELARLAEQLDDARLRLLRRSCPRARRTRRCRTRRVGPCDGDAGGRRGPTIERTGRSSSRHHITSVVVAERADHRDARALLGVGELVGQHRHLDAEQRRAHRGAEAALVARVVGMGDERRRTRAAARAAWSRWRCRRRTWSAGGTRPAARGPRARPGRRRS